MNKNLLNLYLVLVLLFIVFIFENNQVDAFFKKSKKTNSTVSTEEIYLN